MSQMTEAVCRKRAARQLSEQDHEQDLVTQSWTWTIWIQDCILVLLLVPPCPALE